MTNHDLKVLRALARLSRMRKRVDLDSLALRAGGSHDDVRASLGRLSREQMIDRSSPSDGVRLTFAGLTLAVASGGLVIRTANRSIARSPKRRAA